MQKRASELKATMPDVKDQYIIVDEKQRLTIRLGYPHKDPQWPESEAIVRNGCLDYRGKETKYRVVVKYTYNNITGRTQAMDMIDGEARMMQHLGLSVEPDSEAFAERMHNSRGCPMLYVHSATGHVLQKEQWEELIRQPITGQIAGSMGKVPVRYLCMQRMDAVDLFQLVSKQLPLRFPEGVVCHLFLGTLNELQRVHTLGVAHLDVKLENVLCNREGKLTIIDYGGAMHMSQMFGGGGTFFYGAPEVHTLILARRNRSGLLADIPLKPIDSPVACDVFSLGVLLFVTAYAIYPFFEKAVNTADLRVAPLEEWGKMSDWTTLEQSTSYAIIYSGYHREFWDYTARFLKLPCPPPRDFVDLLNLMFDPCPELRPSLDEIVAHPWCSRAFRDKERVADVIAVAYDKARSGKRS